MTRRTFTADEARAVGEQLGIDWTSSTFDVEQFRANVTSDDPLVTGKIALAHLREFSDYYTRLARMETEAEAGH